MKKIILIFTLTPCLLNCNKEEKFTGPNFFEDSFESYSELNDLLLPDNELWSYSQLTKDENKIIIDTSRFYSGGQSMKFTAVKGSAKVASKSSLAKQNMAFWEGETVRISAWYFIEGTKPLDWLFLIDLEEQVSIGAGPGMRIALMDDLLRIEHKFFENDVEQNTGNEVPFPRNKWVEIVWEVKLSQKNKGTIKLWQDGQLVIDSKDNRTLPKDALYFQQGTKGMYSSLQVGITANSRENEATLWVDDVKIEKIY